MGFRQLVFNSMTVLSSMENISQFINTKVYPQWNEYILLFFNAKVYLECSKYVLRFNVKVYLENLPYRQIQLLLCKQVWTFRNVPRRRFFRRELLCHQLGLNT